MKGDGLRVSVHSDSKSAHESRGSSLGDRCGRRHWSESFARKSSVARDKDRMCEGSNHCCQYGQEEDRRHLVSPENICDGSR